MTEKATQERKIETDLIKIEEQWNLLEFEQTPLKLKDGSINLLKMNDEHLELLDDHQLLIQSIASNKFLAYYEARVLKWQKGLANVNETIRLLSEVQKTWSFLINLFIYSEEVKKELPKESKHFIEIDRHVRAILKISASKSNIFEFSNFKEGGQYIMDRLDVIFNELNQCQKGLNNFIA